jgi:hypothetical protein
LQLATPPTPSPVSNVSKGTQVKKLAVKEATELYNSAPNLNTELTIHALDQVHCWDAYFRLQIGHYENFTPLNFQPLLFSKQ